MRIPKIALPNTALLVALLALSVPVTGQHTLAVTQPGGPGTIRLDVTGVQPNAELYNLVQATPHSPTGGGPIFGLGLAGSEGLLSQILSPLPLPPIHVLADGSGNYTWNLTSTPLGAMVPVDVVSIQWNAGFVSQSSVVFVTLDL
ncbi:MAG: hypothetical protein CMJ83_22265 [Planctomycetes bacterium]|nr:hypothetical protein [Planctomycetota bacterium]